MCQKNKQIVGHRQPIQLEAPQFARMHQVELVILRAVPHS
jgi:hypothetical protein